MELTLTDDQELLRDTAVRFMEAACPLETVRHLFDDGGTDLPQGYLREAAELGWFSLLVPEEFGGGSISGDGLRDAAIVAEERGRRLQPGPFVAMNVVAGALARRGTAAQRDSILPAVMAGESVAAWVANDATGQWAPGRVPHRRHKRRRLRTVRHLRSDPGREPGYLAARRCRRPRRTFPIPGGS